MIRFFVLAAAAALALLTSCSGEPTVQKYFVEKSESPDFIAVDLSPSFIKTDSLNISEDQKKAINSVKSINVLVFNPKQKNAGEFNTETTKVKGILKTDHYDELIKINHDGFGASINTKGEGEHIEEFVLYAQSPETGFGVVRVTGNDMTPSNVMTIAEVLQKANLDTKQLEPLKQLLKEKQQHRIEHKAEFAN
ncbi:DUF4252 domain-containing protein [Flavobacterium sp. RHBU_3]|uniref:DUF4252 domain-containing protein n=1 Tax=Flavobacterium sp. RHBU_3 TaxID=3391184 RepID=UPI00398481FC